MKMKIKSRKNICKKAIQKYSSIRSLKGSGGKGSRCASCSNDEPPKRGPIPITPLPSHNNHNNWVQVPANFGKPQANAEKAAKKFSEALAVHKDETTRINAARQKSRNNRIAQLAKIRKKKLNNESRRQARKTEQLINNMNSQMQGMKIGHNSNKKAKQELWELMAADELEKIKYEYPNMII